MERRNLLKSLTVGSIVLATSGPTLMVAGCSTSWITTAVDDIPTISNIVGSVLSIVALGNPALSPELSALINAGLQAASAALVTVQSLISDYKTAPNASILTKIDAALTDVQTNLSSVLSAAHIKDAALQATISTGISLALTVLSTIQLLIPATVSSRKSAALNVSVDRSQAKNAVPQKISVVPSNTLKMMYNVVASSCGYSAQVVK